MTSGLLDGSSKTRDSADMDIGLQFDEDLGLGTDGDQIIAGVLGRGDIGVIYGPSSVGKTFFVLDIAYRIAHGEPIGDRETQTAAVLYVGYEGLRSLAARRLALVDAHGDSDRRVAAITRPAALDKSTSGKNAADATIEKARRLRDESGIPVGLIVIDTLARAMAGDDDSSSADVSSLIEKRVRPIVEATGAAVLIVHHPGKDRSKGMRGSSALHAALDVVIRVTKNGTVELEKVRDGEEGKWLAFDLCPATVTDEKSGISVDTRIVQLKDAGSAGRDPHNVSKTQQAVVRHLRALIDEGHCESIVTTNDFPGDAISAVDKSLLVERCVESGDVTTSETNARSSVQTRIGELERKGILGNHGGYVWLNPQE